MPKHRSTVYTVVRETYDSWENQEGMKFSGVVGVYLTPERADEVAGAYLQEMKDQFPDFDNLARFTVHASTWYEE